MDAARAAVLCTVGVIVLVSLSTGPLFQIVHVPEAKTVGDSIGQGDASVSVVSAPDTVRLRAGGFDTAVYYVDVPGAELELADVRGTPMLSYELSVPEMGYSRNTVHFVDQTHEGPYVLSIDRDSMDPDRIDRERYEGRLRILLRSDGSERVIYDERVSVEVSE